MPKGIMYLETMPVSAAREAEYHKWYNDTHSRRSPRSRGSFPPAVSRDGKGLLRSAIFDKDPCTVYDIGVEIGVIKS
jgi:hypothetical protein